MMEGMYPEEKEVTQTTLQEPNSPNQPAQEVGIPKESYYTTADKPLKHIRIGTRGSKLAVWQAKHIAEILEAHHMTTEIITIETKGDKILNKSLAKIGSKGIFTAEIEEQLREGTIDIAVHSAKDMPSELPPDLEIIAYTKRELAHDVVISFNKNTKLAHFDSSFIVGTSSTRRVALLRYVYPNIRTADARGNLNTRMKKLEEGYYDALILAYAGVLRMNFQDYIVETLPIDVFVPAIGQGSIAVEVSTHLGAEKIAFLKELINDKQTEICINAERAFLKEFQGGCNVPVFGYATLDQDEIHLVAGVAGLDGTRIVKKEIRGSVAQAEELGIAIAKEVVASGGREIMQNLKRYSS